MRERYKCACEPRRQTEGMCKRRYVQEKGMCKRNVRNVSVSLSLVRCCTRCCTHTQDGRRKVCAREMCEMCKREDERCKRCVQEKEREMPEGDARETIYMPQVVREEYQRAIKDTDAHLDSALDLVVSNTGPFPDSLNLCSRRRSGSFGPACRAPRVLCQLVCARIEWMSMLW